MISRPFDTAATLGAGIVDTHEIDEPSREGAEQRAEEKARLARDAGVDAQPLAVGGTTVAEAVLGEAY